MGVDDCKLSKELEYLLASYLFENKLQMQRLLRYLVSYASSANDAPFDQRAIAKECLGRSNDFDPAENPVVRIEIGRLRKLLRLFYEEELPRPYKITIPKGQYRPLVTLTSLEDQPKYLPELAPSPVSPERLSVLLQFATEGVDNTGLYLLRHQLRIGITIALSRQETIRLLVALPGERRQLADSIDFVMRVSVSQDVDGFELFSEVFIADSEEALYRDKKTLSLNYVPRQIDEALSILVSDLFDHEIGRLWRQWSVKRENYDEVGASRVEAFLRYQRYLFDETASNSERAFTALTQALEYHPSDKILSLALADIYYRINIHGYKVANTSISEALKHVREALRFSPSSEKLNILHALLTLFDKKYDFVVTSLSSANAENGIQYFSVSFHWQVLRCLMSEWAESFNELERLCAQYSTYPKLFPVLAYLNYVLKSERQAAEHWKSVVRKQSSQLTVKQCVSCMKLPENGSGATSRKKLIQQVTEDLG